MAEGKYGDDVVFAEIETHQHHEEHSSNGSREVEELSKPRNSYQIRALLRKNMVMQWRQRKTNLCQIGFPVFLMVLLGVLALAYEQATGTIAVTTEPPFIFNPGNTSFPCAFASYTVNNRTGDFYDYYDPANFTGDVQFCGTYDHLYFVNPSSGEMAGDLTNSTAANYTGSGLLGAIQQHTYIYPETYNGGGEINAPFFDEYSSADDVNSEIYTLITQQKDNITVMWEMPTAAVLFSEINTSENASQTLHYTLQMQPQPYGPINLEATDQQTAMYPPLTNLYSQFRTVQYLSYFNSALMSIGLNGLNYTGTKPSITTSTQSMTQLYYPYVYPMAAVGGCSLIPMACAFLLPVFVYLLVLEKEEKHLEMMRIMGLKKSTYWIVNFIFFVALYTLVFIVVLIIGLSFALDIFLKTNPLVYTVHFLLWGVLQIAFGFLLSTLFRNPRTASFVSYLLVILGVGFCYEISLFLIGADSSGITYFLIMLYPTFPFVRGVYLMEHPFFVPRFAFPYSIDVFITFNDPLMVCWYYMIGEIFLCMLLTVYFDKVMPRSYGVQLSPLYPIHWVIKKVKQVSGTDRSEKQKEMDDYDMHQEMGAPTDGYKLTNEAGDVMREEDPDCAQERLRARNPNIDSLLRIVELDKVYKSTKRGQKDKHALRKLAFTVSERECFGLLGPNGAGKTTLQSLLCGLYAPTSGYAMLAGHRIPEETEAIYTLIGYCPQHDVLWGDLTIEEHLLFYCRLKGISSKEEKLEVAKLVDRVGLTSDAKKRASELSGGMKRRLSVAISLIGEPIFVLLDEPTTGVDPVNRRAIWDILAREKKGRCLILTTHNMEEADVLCDRIGIMARGQLICIGTQAHLKKKFGSGFTLQLNSSNKPATHEFVSRLYAEAKHDLDNSMNDILCYRIPQNTTMDLPSLFEAMREKEKYGIREWSIQPTTLEEVFLKVFEFEEAAEDLH